MGRKRNRQSDLPEDGSDGSSESCEGTDGINLGGKCKHTGQSINLIDVRKALKKTAIQRECPTCEKDNKTPAPVEEGIEPCPPMMWMCLQCGNQACGHSDKNHAMEHFKVPRTGSHSLVIDTLHWKVWCYECNIFLIPDSCPRLSRAVGDLKKMAISFKSKASPKALQKELPTPDKGNQKELFGLTKVVGLTNLGNTCFFNAVLQCLAQTPFLVKVLEDLQKPGQTFVLPGGTYKEPKTSEEITLPRIEGTLEYPCPVTEVLQKTLTDMQNANNNETYKPSELLNVFRKKSTQCMDGGQHDSHELLRHLLELVRAEDLNRYKKVILNSLGMRGPLLKNNNEDKIPRLKFYGHQASARLLGPEPVFKGILISTLECLECHHISPRTEPFLDLSLPVMADKPQPPVFKRKSSGFEDAFDLMNSNSSNSGNKASTKRESNATRKAAKLKQRYSKFLNSELKNTLETGDDSENSKNEKPRDYSASVGSDSDVEDNAETESGNEPLLKSQEILESGYSSEKPSALASPVSPEDSHESKDVDSSLKSLNGPESFTLADTDRFTSLKNGDSLENSNSTGLELNFRNSSETKENPFPILEAESSLDLVSPDGTTANLISSSNNSVESPSSPVEKEVNDEKILGDVKTKENGENGQENCEIGKENGEIEKENGENGKENDENGKENDENGKENDENGKENGENGKENGENGKETEDLLKCYGPETESESKKISSPENKSNEDYTNTNGVVKITTSISRFGINHSNQSPSRYSTCEREFSIQSCLNQFTAQELMTGNNVVGCEACTARENKGKENGKMVCTPSTKQYLISKVPAVLILHLKRFQSLRVGFSKVTKPVNFPTVLDLAPVCKNHNKPKIYSLYGVVEHSGNLYGGHYVAYVKTRQPLSPNDPRWSFLPTPESQKTEKLANDVNSQSENEENSNISNIEPPPGRWYYISDSRVSEVSESAVLQSQAYLLFYERIL